MRLARILFLSEGEDFQKNCYSLSNRIYWSAGFPAVLERHGFLSVSYDDASRLNDLPFLSQFDVVLIAQCHPDRFTNLDVSALFALDTQFIFEGHAPAAFLKAIELSASAPRDRDARLVPAKGAGTTTQSHYGLNEQVWLKQICYSAWRTRVEPWEWGLAPNCPIDLRMATLWPVVPATFAPLTLLNPNATQVLVNWHGDSVVPAIVRQHNITYASIEIFAFAAYGSTCEPFAPLEYRSRESFVPAESLVISLIDGACARAGKVRVRLLPWPYGVDWVLNVRHDFDRDISVERTEAYLNMHAANRTQGTWYWLAKHAKSKALAMIACDPNHEVALHSERVYFGGEAEQAVIEKAAGHSMRGVTAHGGTDSFQFQGAPNLLWACQQNMLYHEFVHRDFLHPGQFIDMDATGVVRRRDMVVLSKHISLDLTAIDGAARDDLVPRILAVLKYQPLVQVMNHPDINLEPLNNVLSQLPQERRLDWTAERASAWWKNTHNSNFLKMTIDTNGQNLLIKGQKEVERLALEFRSPDGDIVVNPVQNVEVSAQSSSLYQAHAPCPSFH